MTAAAPPDAPTCLFVYGTLQRGECRERCWPHPPLAVSPAETQGRLFDLGPYPALLPGDDRVAGELWQIAAEHLPATLAALDAVEGYAGDDGDLYVRRIIVCRTAADMGVPAFAYFLAQDRLLAAARRLPPGPDGLCRWPRSAAPP